MGESGKIAVNARQFTGVPFPFFLPLIPCKTKRIRVLGLILVGCFPALSCSNVEAAVEGK